MTTRLTGVSAGPGEHLDDAARRGGLDAHELFLVELRLAARLDGGDACAVRGPHGLDDRRRLGPGLRRVLLLGGRIAASRRERHREEDERGRAEAHDQFSSGPPTAASSW